MVDLPRRARCCLVESFAYRTRDPLCPPVPPARVRLAHARKFFPQGPNFLALGDNSPIFPLLRFCRGKGGVLRKLLFRPPLSSWVGAAAMARFGVNTFGRVGARMATLGHGVTAIKGERAYKAGASARTVPVPIPEGDAESKDHFVTKDGLTFAGSHLIIDFWGA